MSTLSANFNWSDVRACVIEHLRSKMPTAVLPPDDESFGEFSLDDDGATIEWETPEHVAAPVSYPFPRD